MDVEMVKKYIQVDQVKDQVCSRRAIDVVVKSATAVKPEETPAEPAAEETPAAEAKPKRTRKKKAEPAEGEEPAAEEKKPARKPRKKKTEETEEPKDAE